VIGAAGAILTDEVARGPEGPPIRFRERFVAPGNHGKEYLREQQRPDGSWLPLWFGDRHAPDDVNPTCGTAKVLAAYRDLEEMPCEQAQRGLSWLVANQNHDGGWGGCKGARRASRRRPCPDQSSLAPGRLYG
jgi:squalene cyclase